VTPAQSAFYEEKKGTLNPDIKKQDSIAIEKHMKNKK